MKTLRSAGTVRILAALLVLPVGTILGAQTVQASTVGPSVDFAIAANYDNTANTVLAGPTPQNNQTFGLFRDVFWWGNGYGGGSPGTGSPDFINTGKSLILTNNHAAPNPLSPYTALNFTGEGIPNGGQTFLSIYDNLALAGHNTFDAAGGLRIFADVLFANPGHRSTGGVVALYNEGQDGIALLAYQGGGNNHDFPSLALVWKSALAGQTLTSIDLPATTFDAAEWYRVVMDLTVNTGLGTFDVTGNFYNHSDPTNPNSPLAVGPAIATLSIIGGSLSNPDGSACSGTPAGNNTCLNLTNPGEIGVMAGNTGAFGDKCIPGTPGNPAGCTGANPLVDNIGVSIYCFNGCGTVPEPASLLLLGSGLIGLAGWRWRRRNA